MKKTITILLALMLCLSLFAACGTSKPTGNTDDSAVPVDDSTQNPVMNYVGDYMNDRCSMTLQADGALGAKVTAYWGDTAKDGFQWELTGTFDEATMRINYTDAVKKSVTYTDVDVFQVNDILFENGKGYIQINTDGTLTWFDEQDENMSFEPLEFQAPKLDTDTTAAADATDATATGEAADTTAAPASTSAADAQETRKLADFAGTYQSDRCSIVVKDAGNGNATIEVSWGSSATETAEWTMSGAFDGDTMRINYSDGVKKVTTYAEDGSIVESKTAYENGVGRIQFYGDGTMAWQDEQEADQLIGMVFDKLPADGQ